MKDLISTLREQCEIHKEKEFVIDIDNDIKLSFQELWARIETFSEYLLKTDVRKGECVGLVLKNSIDFMVSFYAILKIEAVPLPLNPALKKRELEYIFEDAKVRILLAHPQVMEAYDKITIKEKQCIDKHFELLVLGVEEKKFEKRKEDFALLLYTSGSTGEPKGVMLTHSNLLAEMKNIAGAHKLKMQDRVLCVLPWYHINGLVITMLTPLLVGHKIYVTEKFRRHVFWKQISENQITWFSGVPIYYSYLLADRGVLDIDVSCLRFARSASASLPVSVIKEFEARFGIPIIESYGMTEGGSQLTSNPLPPEVRKPGSVGIPYGNIIRIVDDSGNDVKIGVEGEVYVKGDNITQGYLNKSVQTEESIIDGWLKTGDLGYLDEDEYLFLSGRKKELINRSGEKFAPREIDEVLYELQEVEVAATVGIPHEIYGEKVVSFIKLKKGKQIKVSEVKEYCRTRLMDVKVPKEIYFIEDFPLGANGKLQRLKLRDVYKSLKGDF